MPAKTNRRLAALLIAAGVVAAFQVGKGAVGVPLLRQDLALSLAAASWVIGTYATLGAVAGFAAGVGVSMVGARRALVGGMTVIAAGSLMGALATNGTVLLATRVVESCGFLAAVIAIPSLLRVTTAPADRDVVFTCWGAYMPAGTAIMMLLGPPLAQSGWQWLWLANGVLALAFAGLLFAVLSRIDAQAGNANTLKDAGTVLRASGPWLLAAAFCLYTFQYFALTGLLPTLLVERMGLSIAAAGAVSAATVMANAIGNLAAAMLAKAGIPIWFVMISAFAILGPASLGIFSAAMPLVGVAVIAMITLAVTGLVPASIFAASPRIASGAAMLAIVVGLLTQASNFGQFLGPAALGSFVQAFGWSAAPLLFFAVAAAGVTIALAVRRVTAAAVAGEVAQKIRRG